MKYLKLVKTDAELINPQLDSPSVYLSQESLKVEYFGAKSGPKYETVDMGLPSGLKWASMNVGATSEEECGLYFAWGETIGYDNSLTERIFSDSEYLAGTATLNTNITSEYDAATVNMGGNWRMPTINEFVELYDNSNKTIETINGNTGVRFTSKINGNSVFFPICGCIYNGFIDKVITSLWTKVIDTSLPRTEKSPGYAWPIIIGSDGTCMTGENQNRAVGGTVRGVCE